MKRFFSLLFSFFPLTVFVTYAFYNGEPNGERWMEAYQIGSTASFVQLFALTKREKPLNRLILGANIYLLVGGVAATFEQWEFFKLYGDYQESAVLLSILAVGVATTFFSRAGFVGVQVGDERQVRLFSLILLVATVVCFIVSYLYRGHATLAGVLPILALSFLNRYFSRKLETHRQTT